MDITGLTQQQSGVQVASRVLATSGPRPRVSDKTEGTSTPALLEPGAGQAVQAAVDALAARRQDTVRSGARIYVDEATNRVVIQIVNADDEVIRQIPPEEILRIAERFQKLTGIIFDREV